MTLRTLSIAGYDFQGPYREPRPHWEASGLYALVIPAAKGEWRVLHVGEAELLFTAVHAQLERLGAENGARKTSLRVLARLCEEFTRKRILRELQDLPLPLLAYMEDS